MDRFIEKYKLPKLNQEDINTLSNPITANETQNVIKKLTDKEKSGT